MGIGGVPASLVVLILCFFQMPTKAHCLNQEDERVCYYLIHCRTDSSLRVAHVLIDEVDFSETKLRRLMNQFRDKYPEHQMLVFLYSKLDQLYFFSGNTPSVALGHVNAKEQPIPRNKYASGILTFNDDNRVIRYNTPGGERHTIVVQGVDPMGRR